MISKKKKHFIVIVISLVILLITLYLAYLNTDFQKRLFQSLTFEITTVEESFSFQPEKLNDQNLSLFLPAYLSGNTTLPFTILYDDSFVTLCLDGTPYQSGDTWTVKNDETIHQLQLSTVFDKTLFSIPFQLLCSEQVPALFVSLDKGSFVLTDEHSVLYRSTLATFKVRGNLTSELEKKPYTLCLPSNQPASFLGMSSATKWNLLANATDGSYIRNKAILDLANDSISYYDSNVYEPNAEFIDLYLNGRYQGLYLLTEAVEIGETRLNIDPDRNWLIEMEMENRTEAGTSHVITNGNQYFEIHTSHVSYADESEIKEILNDVESALFASDGISFISGKSLDELIDMKSWADNWLIEEISGDHDVGLASQYAYIARDEQNKLYAGPVWDFDGAMGNVYLPRFKYPKALTVSVPNVRREGTFEWMAAFYQNPTFQNYLATEYRDHFSNSLEQLLSEKIPAYYNYAGRSMQLDSIRWADYKSNWVIDAPKDSFTTSDFDYPDNSFSSHVAQVTDYLTAKKEFLDQMWVEGKEFCVVHTINKYLFNDHYFNQDIYYFVEKGTAITDLLNITAENHTQIGYFDVDTGKEIVNGSIIDHDMTLEGIWEYHEN